MLTYLLSFPKRLAMAFVVYPFLVLLIFFIVCVLFSALLVATFLP